MRTAEEIILEKFECKKKSQIMTNHFIGLTVIEAFKEAMIEYASEACREQREICADVYAQGAFYANPKLEEKISNAPSPEMK